MSDAILAIGQSHVAAIRAAARIRREADPERPRTRVIHTLEPRYAPELVDGDAAFGPELIAAIRDQVDRHRPRIVSCIGGNVHAVLGLIRHPVPFDFALNEDAPDPDAQPLTQGMMRAVLAAAMAQDLARLRLLAGLVGPVLHLQSPPPLRDDALIAARADAFFRDRDIAGRGVARAGLRHRLWRLHSRIVAETCADLGIRFVPVPAEVLDADGFLAPALAGDATHGNAAYGEAMIRAVEAQPWPM